MNKYILSLQAEVDGKLMLTREPPKLYGQWWIWSDVG